MLGQRIRASLHIPASVHRSGLLAVTRSQVLLLFEITCSDVAGHLGCSLVATSLHSMPPTHASQVLLLDEITVDMDVVGRLDLLHFFKQECEERGATIIYVSGTAVHAFD